MQLFPFLSHGNMHLPFQIYPKNFYSSLCDPALSYHSSCSISTQSHRPFSPSLEVYLFDLQAQWQSCSHCWTVIPSFSLLHLPNAKLSFNLTSSDRPVFHKDGHNKLCPIWFSAMRPCYYPLKNRLYSSTPLNLGRTCDILIKSVAETMLCPFEVYTLPGPADSSSYLLEL